MTLTPINVDILSELLSDVFESNRVIIVYLFGSVAEDVARADSDIDFAVLLPNNMNTDEQGKRQLSMIYSIGEKLHRDDVDVVVLNKAPVELQHQVLKHGKILYCSDGHARVDFEVAVLRRYFDIQPQWKVYYHFLMKRIKEGRMGERFRPRKSESTLESARRVQKYLDRIARERT
jgi:predicted nucleotidyltransferase